MFFTVFRILSAVLIAAYGVAIIVNPRLVLKMFQKEDPDFKPNEKFNSTVRKSGIVCILLGIFIFVKMFLLEG
jgi:hypothetical protein